MRETDMRNLKYILHIMFSITEENIFFKLYFKFKMFSDYFLEQTWNTTYKL